MWDRWDCCGESRGRPALSRPGWRKLVAALPLLASLGTHTSAQEPSAEDGLVPPEVAIQEGDLAHARAAFQTKLLRKGAAPARAAMPGTPPGVTRVEFPSGDLRLAAWLQRPAGDDGGGSTSPGVVFLHGGFALGVEDWRMAAPFLEAGYVLLAPILRGENGQGGTFTLFYDEVDDVLAAGRFLAGQAGVDPKRVYVAGHSVGGTLALLAAQSSRQFRAAASFSGSPDQVIYCRLGIAAEQIPFDVGDPHELELRSPLAFARSFQCPVRMFYGTGEPHFRLSTERTAELASAAHLDVQAIRVEGGHESAVPAEVEQSLLFFEER